MMRFLLSTFPERTCSDGQLHALISRYPIAMVRHVNAIANQIEREGVPGYQDWTLLSHATHRAAVLLTLRARMKLRSDRPILN